MKESTRKKILGKKIYPAYRRMRFLLYKKRLLKKQKKSAQIATLKEGRSTRRKSDSFQYRLYKIYRLSLYSLKKRSELRKEARIKLKAQRIADITEKKSIRDKIKEKKVQDRLLEQLKEKAEKNQIQEERRLNRQETRQRRKERRKQFIHEIKTFDRHTLQHWFRRLLDFTENRDKRHNFFVISGNSLVLFLLSYMTIYILSQLITVLVATTFDYKTILYYYKIYYDIESHAWNADSVKILFSILPVNGLFMGIIFIILFNTFRHEPGNFKLFFLWGFVHGVVMFFGSLLMGTLLNKDFGWVIAYLYYRDTGKMIFSIISIFALVAIGGLMAKSFLISGNSYFNFINKRNRKFLLSSQVVFPAITGTFLLALIKIPDQFYYGTVDEMYFEFLKLFSLIILIIPLIMAFRSYDEIYFDEEPRRIFLNWKLLIITGVVVITYRFGLIAGITFGQ
jgi:hypothetical protein